VFAAAAAVAITAAAVAIMAAVNFTLNFTLKSGQSGFDDCLTQRYLTAAQAVPRRWWFSLYNLPKEKMQFRKM
jgi:hypothetical protein